MLDCLGLQRTYWNAFCNGHRPISGLIRHKERRDWLAEFLGVPPITLRIWAGDIGEDEPPFDWPRPLWLEMERARKDIRFNVLTPKSKAEFDKLPANIKLLMVTMYRTITEHDLSDQKRLCDVSPPSNPCRPIRPANRKGPRLRGPFLLWRLRILVVHGTERRAVLHQRHNRPGKQAFHSRALCVDTILDLLMMDPEEQL
jgi:hypothetical protein